MRDVSSQLRDVLDGGVYSVEWVADLYYDGDPKAQNLGILDPQFAWDMSAQIQGSGSCQILWDDLFGQSVVPREIGDLFSPFGAELQVDVIVSAGGFSERVPMGRFVLDAVPDSVEYAIANANPPKVAVYGPWVEQRRNLIYKSFQLFETAYRISGCTVAISGGVMTITPTGSGAWFVQAGDYPTTGFYHGIEAGGAYRVLYESSVPLDILVWYYGTSNVAVSPVGGVVTIPASANGGGAVRFAGTGPAVVTLSKPTLVLASDTSPEPFTGSSVSSDLTRYSWVSPGDNSPSVMETRESTIETRPAEPVVVESRVSLDLSDYFLRIARDSFPFPSSPQSTSMWDEAQRLTGLAVVRSIDDRALPTNIAYDEDRLEALGKVFSPSDAWPTLSPTGALTARPKDWPEPVDRLETVLDAPLVMQSENVYNRVVVEGKSPDTSEPPLIAVAELLNGFLRTQNHDGTRSPFGGNTYRYSSDFLTTQAQCQDYANEMLPRVSRIRSVTRRVTIPFNPLHEVGDVLILSDPTRMGDESLVRIRSIDHNDGQTVLEVEVSDDSS